MSTNISRFSTIGTIMPDRAVLRTQLEETRAAFHALIDSLTDADWHRETVSTVWTVGEVMTHITVALTNKPKAIEHVRQGKDYMNLQGFLNWLTPMINRWLVKLCARGQTRETILARYDQAHTAMVVALEGIRDDEWGLGASCYGEGYKTILDLCMMPNSHFQEHASQVVLSK